MKRFILALALMVLISGCAQNQSASSLGRQPTTKSFDACGLSVRFSGEPDKLQGAMLDAMTEEYETAPTGPAWTHILVKAKDQVKVEIAMCLCPQEPKLSLVKSGFIANGKVVEGIGRTTEFPVIETDAGIKMLTNITQGIHAPNCFIYQAGAGNGTPEEIRSITAPFFSSLAVIPKKPQAMASNQGSGSASERLKRLDQLLSEKLITSKEYETRRTAILESL